jgi:hypothetical protein
LSSFSPWNYQTIFFLQIDLFSLLEKLRKQLFDTPQCKTNIFGTG